MEDYFNCSICMGLVRNEDNKCPHCGARFEEDDEPVDPGWARPEQPAYSEGQGSDDSSRRQIRRSLSGMFLIQVATLGGLVFLYNVYFGLVRNPEAKKLAWLSLANFGPNSWGELGTWGLPDIIGVVVFALLGIWGLKRVLGVIGYLRQSST